MPLLLLFLDPFGVADPAVSRIILRRSLAMFTAL